ncbi:MAG: hypothetical protein WCY19_03555 [Candidatus Gastranaerophilaceae bacterium]
MNLTSSLSILGKYLDQPRLVRTFSRAVPAIAVTGGTLCALNNVSKSPKGKKRKEFIKNVAVLTGALGSALFAPKIASKILKEHSHESKIISSEAIDEFLHNNLVTERTRNFLNLAKKNFLKFSKVKAIVEELETKENGRNFLNELIPNPENINSKEIFSEIKKLSIMGIIPVLGGIAGGVVGDKLTEKNWKEKIPDKIKEGTYQFLANIFLCNVGAGAALWGMEKAKIQSKSARAIGMIGGIILAGIVFGSAVANLVGKICVDPLLKHKDKKYVHRHVDLYSERRPELLDISLHVDDIATVAVLSGLKWIEPALPILYSISGYRAGIGYRNGKH